MLRTSRKYAKSVFPLCIVLALLSAGKSVAELLIAPAILNKIELSASLGSVVFTIAAFALVLMLLSGLRSYVDTNALFGRIAVRSQGIYLSISRKYAETSYPNLLNTDFLALGKKGKCCLRRQLRGLRSHLDDSDGSDDVMHRLYRLSCFADEP